MYVHVRSNWGHFRQHFGVYNVQTLQMSSLLRGNDKLQSSEKGLQKSPLMMANTALCLFISLFLFGSFSLPFYEKIPTLFYPEPWGDLSLCVYLTGVRSRFLSSHIQLQEVLVARCAAKPGFAKMNRAGQKVRVASRMHAALFGNIDASTPTTPSGSTPSKHFALLSEQPTQSHHNRGVAVSTRCHTSKNANAGYRDGNRRDKEEIKSMNQEELQLKRDWNNSVEPH